MFKIIESIKSLATSLGFELNLINTFWNKKQLIYDIQLNEKKDSSKSK